jgi:hypothetical protein
MTYNAARDPFSTTTPTPISSGRNWYGVTGAMLGAAELPDYGKAMRVRNATGADLVLVVVPVAETNDATTDTLTFGQGVELLPFGVRRIVSINGGTTVPANSDIKIVTQ